MATQVQRRRGNTAQNDAFLGALGELAFNTELIGLRLHDGATVGGHRIAMFSDIVAGSSPPFSDSTALVAGSATPSKLLRFEVDGFTAATTRVLTPQNSNYVIAGTDISNEFSAGQFFSGDDGIAIGSVFLRDPGLAGVLEISGLVGPITQTVGALFRIQSGVNQRAGNVTLVAGTATVSNTTVTANTIVMLMRKTSGGTLGTAITYTVSVGTSFTVNSDSALDTSTFSYFLIEVP